MGCNTNSTALPSFGTNGTNGTPGAPGTNGEDAITVIVSNEAYVLSSSNSGNVFGYVGSGTTIRVYDGVTLIPYDGVGTSSNTWKVTTSTVNITVGTLSGPGSFLTVGDHTGVADITDNSKIVYTITGVRSNNEAFTFVKEQNFSKSKIGASGAAGTTKSYLLYNNTTPVATTGGGGVTQLPTLAYPLPGGTLAVNGDILEISAFFTSSLGAGSEMRYFKLYLGSAHLSSLLASATQNPLNPTSSTDNKYAFNAIITRLSDTSVFVDISFTAMGKTNGIVTTWRDRGNINAGINDLGLLDNNIYTTADADGFSMIVTLNQLMVKITKQ